MPVIISMIWGSLAAVLQSLVGRVLLYLGVSYFTYQGVSGLLDSLLIQANNALGGAGVLTGIVGLARIGESLSVVTSALVAKYTLMGLKNGSLTRVLFK
jgi:hypothetical protein